MGPFRTKNPRYEKFSHFGEKSILGFQVGRGTVQAFVTRCSGKWVNASPNHFPNITKHLANTTEAAFVFRTLTRKQLASGAASPPSRIS